MATKPTDGADKMPKPGDIICAFYEDLKNQKKEFDLGRETSKTNMQRANIERGYKLCCLDMAEMTHNYYRDMDNYELFDMLKTVEIISENVENFVAKKTELQGLIQSSSKKLSDLKKKVHQAHDAACAMRNCINRHLDLDDNSESGADSRASKDVRECLQTVMEKSTGLDADSQDAAEAIVKIAGIETFTDLESIQELVASLSDQMSSLHGDVEGYILSANDQIAASQKEVLEVVDTLNTEEYNRYHYKTSSIGAWRTLHFVCHGHCAPIEYVEDICQDMGGNEPGPHQSGGSPIADKDER